MPAPSSPPPALRRAAPRAHPTPPTHPCALPLAQSLAEIQPRGKPETKADADVSKRDVIASATSWTQLRAMLAELDDAAGRNRGLVLQMVARLAEMADQLAAAPPAEVHTMMDKMVGALLEKMDRWAAARPASPAGRAHWARLLARFGPPGCACWLQQADASC